MRLQQQTPHSHYCELWHCGAAAAIYALVAVSYRAHSCVNTHALSVRMSSSLQAIVMGATHALHGRTERYALDRQ